LLKRLVYLVAVLQVIPLLLELELELELGLTPHMFHL
jgi:hypothetical protein